MKFITFDFDIIDITGKFKGKRNNKKGNNDKKRTRVSEKPLEFVAQKTSKVSKDDIVEPAAEVDDTVVNDETEENFKNVLGDDG